MRYNKLLEITWKFLPKIGLPLVAILSLSTVVAFSFTILMYGWSLLYHIINGFEEWKGLVPFIIEPLKYIKSAFFPALINLPLFVFAVAYAIFGWFFIIKAGNALTENMVAEERILRLFALIGYLFTLGLFFRYYKILLI